MLHNIIHANIEASRNTRSQTNKILKKNKRLIDKKVIDYIQIFSKSFFIFYNYRYSAYNNFIESLLDD